MQDCKVNILGTEYEIKFGNEEKYPSLEGLDGYCDSSTKEIVVDDMKKKRGTGWSERKSEGLSENLSPA